MDHQAAFDREHDEILEAYERGEISNAEMWKQIKGLQRDHRAAAQEAAEEAYRDEMDRW